MFKMFFSSKVRNEELCLQQQQQYHTICWTSIISFISKKNFVL